MDVDQNEIVFMWVPGHVGPWENETADRAAKDPLDKEPTDDLMPSSDMKPLTAKCIHQVWQKEWNESIRVSNKLHEISPTLSDKLLSFCDTREKDTVLNRLHICHSYLTNSFILKKEEPHVCFALIQLPPSNIS